MENGYGGPVWHASVAGHGPMGVEPVWLAGEPALWQVAEHALRGVGDPALGEWRELTPDKKAVHLKRRVSDAEWGGRLWGMDLRGSPEGWTRLRAIKRLPSALAAQEMEGRL